MPCRPPCPPLFPSRTRSRWGLLGQSVDQGEAKTRRALGALLYVLRFSPPADARDQQLRFVGQDDFYEVVSQFCCQQRSEEHTSELQSPCNLVCRLLLEKKKRSSSSGYGNYVMISHSGGLNHLYGQLSTSL